VEEKVSKKSLKVENIVPDIALLSFGNDGHICSIFSNSKKLYCCSYLGIVKPKNRTKRVTLNMKFFEKY
jgi:6-phosphogluconolactonase/glucosamine-6-phosphate isomerase/deaminase